MERRASGRPAPDWFTSLAETLGTGHRSPEALRRPATDLAATIAMAMLPRLSSGGGREWATSRDTLLHDESPADILAKVLSVFLETAWGPTDPLGDAVGLDVRLSPTSSGGQAPPRWGLTNEERSRLDDVLAKHPHRVNDEGFGECAADGQRWPCDSVWLAHTAHRLDEANALLAGGARREDASAREGLPDADDCLRIVMDAFAVVDQQVRWTARDLADELVAHAPVTVDQIIEPCEIVLERHLAGQNLGLVESLALALWATVHRVADRGR